MVDSNLSQRVSPAALLSPVLGLTGPLGLLFGFWTLRHINASDGRLRGRSLTFVGMGISMVVTAALFIGFVAIGVNQARAVSARVECMNNLRQIGVAVQHYYKENDDVFPSGSHGPSEVPPDKRLSFHASILPYLEQRPGVSVKYSQVAATLDFQQPWDAAAHATARGTTIPSYVCRSDVGLLSNGRGETNYVGITGIGAGAAFLPKGSPRAGFFGYDRRVRAEDVKPGTSYLVMMTETTVDNGPWLAAGRPTLRDLPITDRDLAVQVGCLIGATVVLVLPADDVAYIGPGRPFGGLHHGGANVLHVDGSVMFLNDRTQPDVFQSLVQLQHEKLDVIDPP